jgi:hypothetical protein
MAVTDLVPAGPTGAGLIPGAGFAAQVRPAVLAGERLLAVPGPVGDLLPGGGLQRGTVTVVDGVAGAGATSVLMQLLAAVTAAGEWAALVDNDGVVGAIAAAEAGVVLDRLGVIRRVPRDQWAAVVAALIEGTALVVTVVPRGARATDARRLGARARERGTAVVAVGPWPGDAAMRVRAEGSQWHALSGPVAQLGARSVRVTADARRYGRARAVDLILPPLPSRG